MAREVGEADTTGVSEHDEFAGSDNAVHVADREKGWRVGGWWAPVNVCELLAGSFELFIETRHYGDVPYLIWSYVEALAENCFEKCACKSLGRFQAREVW